MKGSRLISFLLLSSCLVSAQTPIPKPTPASSTLQQSTPTEADRDIIKITTNLVQIDAVVTKSGKQITDLTADDFEILEDGKPQRITNFSYISNVVATTAAPPVISRDKSKLPTPPPSIRLDANDTRRTIAFVVDDLGMSVQSIEQSRKALRKFVNQQLSENDLAAIVRTSGEIGALEQFTNDRRILMSAIDHIKWQPCSRMGADVFDYNPRPCSDNMFDSLGALRYIVSGMASIPGRKAMVVLSDNLPLDRQENAFGPESAIPLLPSTDARRPDTSGSDSLGKGAISDVRHSYEVQIHNVAELAIRASVVIYTVDARGLAITFPTAADPLTSLNRAIPRSARDITNAVSQTMRTRSEQIFTDRLGAAVMAQETGGFMISNSNDYELKRLYEDQQGYYLIGFRPLDETFDRKFHHISVNVKRPDLTVRSRKGFYGVSTDETRAGLRSANTLDEALRTPFGANQIIVSLSSLFADIRDTGPVLRISIHVDSGNLSFRETAEGFHDAGFDVKSVAFGDNGRVIYLRSQTATLHLNPEQYTRTLSEGVAYGFDVPLKYAGAAQFRVAVRDRISGQLGTAGQVVIVPDLKKRVLALSGILVTREDSRGLSPKLNDSPSDFADRRFRQGDKLMLAYAVYKARVSNGQPQLTTQTRIFRDGKLIFTGQVLPVSIAGQTDWQRITSGSRLQLGIDFPPGDYILQVIVTDKLAKEKQSIVSQWIDFEVIK